MTGKHKGRPKRGHILTTAETTSVGTLTTKTSLLPWRLERDGGESLTTTSHTLSCLLDPSPTCDRNQCWPAHCSHSCGKASDTTEKHQQSQKLCSQPIHVLDEETEAQAHGAEPEAGIQVSDSQGLILFTHSANSSNPSPSSRTRRSAACFPEQEERRGLRNLRAQQAEKPKPPLP